MPRNDTICAVASPAGHSARAIVRVDGPATPDLLHEFFEIETQKRSLHRPQLRMGDWRARGLGIRCLVLIYEPEHSYTGGLGAEIILPGNPWLLRRVIDEAVSLSNPERPIRVAMPGEFTARALLSGRLTGEQAEGVQALISAGNAHEHSLARSLLDGGTGEQYRVIADEVGTLLALVESGIDFSEEEDIVTIVPNTLRSRIQAVRNEIASLLGDVPGAPVDESLVRIVLLGAPNAGKSTLFNSLLGRPRAIVSDIAGTTRDALIERLVIDPLSGHTPEIELVDLAGLEMGDQTGPSGAAAQDRTREILERADAIVWCDPTGRFSLQGAFADLETESRPVIRVRTKGDLLIPAQTQEALAVCALDGWHVEALRRAIGDLAIEVRGRQSPDGPGSLIARHRRALREAEISLCETIRILDAQESGEYLEQPETIAGSLRIALDRIGEISGRIEPDDIIGRIFATFCIGK